MTGEKDQAGLFPPDPQPQNPAGGSFTVGGYVAAEVRSALQKSLRRGLEDDALFWATELELSGMSWWLWKCLRTVASEDVGMADPNVLVQVSTCSREWVSLQKQDNDTAKLFMLQAVCILARAPKSRMLDNAWITFFEGEREHREIPDWALDMHTRRGRQMKRGYEHFFSTGAVVAKEAFPDPYEESAKAVKRAKRRKR